MLESLTAWLRFLWDVRASKSTQNGADIKSPARLDALEEPDSNRGKSLTANEQARINDAIAS